VGGVRLFERFRADRIARAAARTRPPTAPPTRRPDKATWTGPAALHVISDTWLQLPTLRSAGWLVDVVGESFYQDAIEAVSGGRSEDGAVVPLVTAQLVREPDNPHDPNAVRVDIGGQTCGYIPRNEAPDYHSTLAAMTEIGRPATCRAWITGGWDRGVLDRGYFGIRLDLHPNLDLAERGAILPFGEGRVSITGEEDAQDHLAALLDGADRVEVIAVLGEPAERIGVWINGSIVGMLTKKMSERYGPWVGEAQGAMLPASCAARVVQGPNKIEVYLKLAKPWPSRRTGQSG
jgi:hypothetical protein